MSTRQLPALLVTAVLALGPVAVAQAQDAGDEQYSDPLAGQTSSPSSTPSATPMPSTAGTSSPSSSPSGSGSVAGTTAATTRAPSSATTAAAGELPRTGLDAWAIAVLGAALLLLGIGLRLRTADARP